MHVLFLIYQKLVTNNFTSSFSVKIHGHRMPFCSTNRNELRQIIRVCSSFVCLVCSTINCFTVFLFSFFSRKSVFCMYTLGRIKRTTCARGNNERRLGKVSNMSCLLIFNDFSAAGFGPSVHFPLLCAVEYFDRSYLLFSLYNFRKMMTNHKLCEQFAVSSLVSPPK